LRIEIKNGKFSVRSKKSEKEDDEFEVEDEEASESGEVEIEEHESRFKIKIKMRGDGLEIKERGIGVLLHFPISIGENNELIITTPAGTKVVVILPSQAVANILQSNIMDRILEYRARFATPTPQASTSAVPSPEASGSASPVSSASATPEATSVASPENSPTTSPELVELVQDIELVMENDTLVYKIKGEKQVKLFGVFALNAPVSVDVSAETGELVTVSNPFYLRFLPFLFTN
jgi:hypothetical protein